MNGMKISNSIMTMRLLAGLLAVLLLTGYGTRTVGAADAADGEEAAWAAITELNKRTPPPELKQGERPTEEQLQAYMAVETTRLEKLIDALADYRTKYPEGEQAKESLTMMGEAIDQAMSASRGKSPKARAMVDKLLAEEDLPDDVALGLYMSKAVTPIMDAEAAGGDSLAEKRLEITGRIGELVKEFKSRYPESPKTGDFQFMAAQVYEYLGDSESARASYQAIIDSGAAMDPRLMDAARQALDRYAYLGKPLDLKFTAIDGREVDLAAMKDKVVLVDFWATWCGPCMEELPEVLKVYEKYHGKGFEIIGISFDQDKEALEKTLKEKGMTWPQYFDGKGWENKFGQEYGIKGIPAMWLVGKDGKVKDVNARQNLGGKVADLLGSEPAAAEPGDGADTDEPEK